MKEWQWWLVSAAGATAAVVVAFNIGYWYSTQSMRERRFRHYETVIRQVNDRQLLPFDVRYRSLRDGRLFVDTEGLTNEQAALQQRILTEALSDVALAELTGGQYAIYQALEQQDGEETAP